ncbi:hypothetical protein VTL71DRAFT_16281 [Oculimacula yallundae]|uniref:Saccharopine dehydrogenase NADP binding domain-containing protein n=1 Tax=Oculimacula yallundae TaxID=86028 RepID=A0ABR4CGA8_9HELO
MSDLIIYGATGYTGRLSAANAKKQGLKFTIAARNEKGLKELAAELGVPFLVFSVDEREKVDAALKDNLVLLNTAGPFFRTAEPLIDAAIRNRVHYLDTAAELDSYYLAEKRDAEANEAGITIMPGAGGSVAQFGSLAGRVILPGQKIKSLDIALAVTGPMSRGSVISATENITTSTLQRNGGEVVAAKSPELVEFDFDNGMGPVQCFQITLPDVITLGKSTGVPNIRTFLHTTGGFPTGDLVLLPDGPTPGERDSNPYQVSVIATAEDGTVRRAVLHTMNGYSFTTLASVEAARRILGGEVQTGFQTPAEVFGAGFAETIGGTTFKFL